MSIRFKPLLTVSINHDYYTGPCRDVEFVVPASLAQTLRSARMIARSVEGRLHLLYEADASGAALSNIVGQTLVFGFRPTNPHFDNFTAATGVGPGDIALYANATTPDTLDAPQAIVLTAGRHSHAPQAAQRPVVLQLLDAHDKVIEMHTLLAGQDAASYDFSAMPASAYSIVEKYGGGLTHRRKLLIDRDLRESDAQSLLSIKIDSGFYNASADLTLNFAARQETLKYYVVAKNYSAADFDLLNVEDSGFVDEGRPQIKFQRKAGADFSPADIPASSLHDGSARIALFESLAPVARRARAPRKIHLNRNGSVLIEHLPFPGPERSQAQLVVHLSKP